MTPSPEAVGLWILVALALLPGIETIVGWIRPRTQKIDQPLRVEAQPKYALEDHTHEDMQSESDCRDTHKVLAATWTATVSEIRASLIEHDRKAEERASDTHERINNLIATLGDRERQVAGEIGELKGKLNNHIATHGSGKHT